MESSSLSAANWRYDVFLNFRGNDTRNTFTSHLRQALRGAGVNTFNDDMELHRVDYEDIRPKLEEAIQGSKISIIVFSKNFAESHWCLDELVKIMECRRSVKQMVLPVFYYINPSDVRHQRGSFAEAFECHEKRFDSDPEIELRWRYHLLQDPHEKPYDSDSEPEQVLRFRNALKEKLLRWRNVLKQAANLAGFVVDGHEAKMIEEIAKVVFRKLNKTKLFLAPHVVGISSYDLKDVISELAVECKDTVRMVGIWGLGGIGKTTIAKAIYNEFFEHFDGSSFVADVRETWQQPHFRVSLQERLLSDTLDMEIKINNIDRGIIVIKERLCRGRVLIIIDDVDHLDQLRAIVGRHDWFGPGSRIIITTRDKHILETHKVDFIYKAEEMSGEKSLELFCLHAFGRSTPSEEYVELSDSVVGYCGGLPLALQVLGSFLFGRSIQEWRDTLEKLRRIPHPEIQQKLRISYDSLDDETVKDIFLDISCFFIGEDRGYVQQILEGCDLHLEIGINLLLERCLVTINEQKKVMVHDLLRDMAREIVREKSPKDPGKWSRLWYHKYVHDVLRKHKGSENVEGISLKLEKGNNISFNTKSFEKMQSLRLLQLSHVRLTGSYKHISKDLRWLCWEGFSLEFIPNNFYLEDLVTMELRYSNLIQVWKHSKLLEKLTYLDLSHSHYLTQTPDFSVLPNLKKLILEDCRRLHVLHDSTGELDKLVLLNLEGCEILGNLSKTFYKLKSLETLILSGCKAIDHLDEDLGELTSLTTLLADKTGIREPPRTIVRLSKLARLSIGGFKASSSNDVIKFFSLRTMPSRRDYSMNLSLLSLNFLRQINISDCNLGDNDIPKEVQCLPFLTSLDTGGNSSSSPPSRLRELDSPTLVDSRVHEVTDLPVNLSLVSAESCSTLPQFPNSISPPTLSPKLKMTSKATYRDDNMEWLVGSPMGQQVTRHARPHFVWLLLFKYSLTILIFVLLRFLFFVFCFFFGLRLS